MICFTTRNKSTANRTRLKGNKKEKRKKKQTRVLSIHVLLSTELFETTRETNSCVTTLIQNVTENHNKINFDDNRLLWLRNMVSKVRTA